jgi:Secretory lipase
MLRLVAPLAVAAVLAAPAASAAEVRTGPPGDAFYRPPAALVPGKPGTVIWARPATGLAALPQAARTTLVLYRSRSATGEPIAVSGTVAFPHGDPPPGGFGTASWGHVTTGSADSCAPSAVRPNSPERERMTRGDPVVRRLLQAGIVVARSDYEGIGPPGRHPYLIGASLARSVTHIVRAARRLDGRVGRRWVATGHSEGGLAALFAGALAPGLAPELDLRGASAVAPPSHLSDLFEAFGRFPLATEQTATLSSLAGLVLGGAGTVEPRLDWWYRNGALSPRAVALLPHLERRCLVELDRPDSWGGMAPSEIAGPRAEEAKPLLYRVLDANDPRTLRIGAAPVRLDQGALDAVAPAPFAEELHATYLRNGTEAELHRYPTATHENITSDAQAAGPLAEWIAARLR